MSNKDVSSRINDHELTKDHPYCFFIYFFDELRGHTPLFAYPSHALENATRRRFLSIHPVWWHQDQFTSSKFHTIDLKS